MFTHPAYTLDQAINGLMAYDQGCTDSGIRDSVLKKAVYNHLHELDRKELNQVLADYVVGHYFSEEARTQGYGLADVKEFIDWLKDEMAIYV